MVAAEEQSAWKNIDQRSVSRTLRYIRHARCSLTSSSPQPLATCSPFFPNSSAAYQLTSLTKPEPDALQKISTLRKVALIVKIQLYLIGYRLGRRSL